MSNGTRASRPAAARAARAALLPVILLGGLLLGFAVGCDEDDALAPFQPEIASLPDSFQLQATGVRNVTLVRNYSWSSSAPAVDVNQATTVTAGSATLVVLDAAGDEIYRRDLAENGTFDTGVGDAGDWTVRLNLSRYSGTLNFRLQAP